MNKEEFLRRLEELLWDIPETERREAVEYYRNYFEDAGPEQEMQIIQELGSPQKVAESIKKDLFGESYQSYQQMHQEEQKEAFERQQRENRNLRKLLILVVAIITFPIWIGILVATVGLLVGAVALVFSLGIALLAVIGAGMVMGFVLAGIGLIKVFTGFLAVGLMAIGLGLLMLALDAVGLVIAAWVIIKVVPKAIRGIIRLCKKPFQKRGAAV